MSTPDVAAGERPEGGLRELADVTIRVSAEIVDSGATRGAAGVQVRVASFAGYDVGGDQAGAELVRMTIACDAEGAATVELPPGTSSAYFEAEDPAGFYGARMWRRGEPAKVRLELNACASLDVSLVGLPPEDPTVLVTGSGLGERLCVPVAARSTRVHPVPLSWSPVSVMLRGADGSSYAAESPVDLEQGKAAKVTISIPEHRGSVRGILVDEGGLPVSRASVLVYSTKANGTFTYSECASAEDGSFLLEALPVVPLSVSIAPPQRAKITMTVDLASRPDVDLGHIVVLKGATIVGRVDGDSLPGAIFGGALPVSGFGDWGMDRFPASGPRSAVDGEGHFQIDHLAPGSYLVWAGDSSVARLASWTGRIVTVDHRDEEVRNLRLGAGGRWQGRLVPFSGASWSEGSRCLAIGLEEPWWSSSDLRSSGETDLMIGVGSWLVGYSADGRWRWVRAMRPGDATTEVVLPNASVTLFAQRPIGPEIQVQLEFLGSGERDAVRGWRTPITRHGVERNSCRLDGLGAGRYRLHAFRGRVALLPLAFELRDGDASVLLWPDDWQ